MQMLQQQASNFSHLPLSFVKPYCEGTGSKITIILSKPALERVGSSGILTQAPQESFFQESKKNTFPNFEKNIDSKSQIEYLRNSVNLNVSQLAMILDVQRPTIYEWLEGKTPQLNNQERLNRIYAFFDGWSQKEGLRMGGYFYKKFDNRKSLYDLLLAKKKFEEELIKEYIKKIRSILLENKKAQQRRNNILKNAGFEPVSNEQKLQLLKRWMRLA